MAIRGVLACLFLVVVSTGAEAQFSIRQLADRAHAADLLTLYSHMLVLEDGAYFAGGGRAGARQVAAWMLYRELLAETHGAAPLPVRTAADRTALPRGYDGGEVDRQRTAILLRVQQRLPDYFAAEMSAMGLARDSRGESVLRALDRPRDGIKATIDMTLRPALLAIDGILAAAFSRLPAPQANSMRQRHEQARAAWNDADYAILMLRGAAAQGPAKATEAAGVAAEKLSRLWSALESLANHAMRQVP